MENQNQNKQDEKPKTKKEKAVHFAENYHYYLAVSIMIVSGVIFALYQYYMLFQAPVYIVPTVSVPHKTEATSTTQELNGTIREVTMYTSRVEETDASPCISADGTDICKVNYNVCASNSHKIGTMLYVRGLGECIVKDRMNGRFTSRIDWYAKTDLQRALKFGKQNLAVYELK